MGDILEYEIVRERETVQIRLELGQSTSRLENRNSNIENGIFQRRVIENDENDEDAGLAASPHSLIDFLHAFTKQSPSVGDDE